ncbi:MAG: hypothetical protein AB1Z23_03145 [Eubacteriales bacterium]
MDRIKKYIIAAVLLAFALAFAGCTELKIDASIDENNMLTYSYKIDVTDIKKDDINYDEVKLYLEKIEQHWEDNGYDAAISTYDGGISIYMEINEQYETRGAALAGLYKCMTNEISPFSDVDYTYNLNYYYEDYTLDASLDFSNIINEQIYTAYPGAVGKEADDFINSAKCTVTISLPINESIEDDVINQNTKSFDVPIDKRSSIHMQGKINNNENLEYERDLIAKSEKQKENVIISAIVLFVSILILAIVIILWGKWRKKKKPQDEEDEKEE